MIAGGELVGVLEVLNKKTSGGFTAGDQGLLESLAGLGAVAIGNARVMGGFRNFYSNTIEILISAIETRDMRMSGHCWRFAQRATSLGRKLGLEGQVLKDLYPKLQRISVDYAIMEPASQAKGKARKKALVPARPIHP